MRPPPDLTTRVGPLELANPILTASGTFGYGLEFAHLTALERIGGLVTKGLSPEPILGNPSPRICETRGGMLNSIGLQNIGIDAYIDDVLPGLGRYPAKIIVNLFGTAIEQYEVLARRVDGVADIAAVELNVSCPNVERGGIEFGHDPEVLADVVAAVRQNTGKPIIVKLSPNVTSPVRIGEAARRGGADALSCINTVLGMAIDADSRRPLLRRLKGGLSGPAIKPIALRIVYDVHREVGLPVIGVGGIESARDVVEFLLAGASAVQIGTALFRTPDAPVKILEDLEIFLTDRNIPAVSDLIGALEPYP